MSLSEPMSSAQPANGIEVIAYESCKQNGTFVSCCQLSRSQRLWRVDHLKRLGGEMRDKAEKTAVSKCNQCCSPLDITVVRMTLAMVSVSHISRKKKREFKC